MPCVDRNKLVYNIKELPEVFNVEPVDLFIVETLDGTSIVSFDNIIFDLSQTTFETAFNKHTTDIQTLSADVDQIINNAGSGRVVRAIDYKPRGHWFHPPLLTNHVIQQKLFTNKMISIWVEVP